MDIASQFSWSIYPWVELKNEVTISNTGPCIHVCRKWMTKYCFLEPVVTCTHCDFALIKIVFCEILFKARLSCNELLPNSWDELHIQWLPMVDRLTAQSWQVSHTLVLFPLIAVDYNNCHTNSTLNWSTENVSLQLINATIKNLNFWCLAYWNFKKYQIISEQLWRCVWIPHFYNHLSYSKGGVCI